MRKIILLLCLFAPMCASPGNSHSALVFLKWRAPASSYEKNLREKLPRNKLVKVSDLVFHDWAYPTRENLKKLEPKTGDVFIKARVDYESRLYHGLKFRLDPAHNYNDSLHKSGPKIIGFLKRSRSGEVNRLKRLYHSRDNVSMTGYYIGLLPEEVWGTDGVQVQEEPMPAFLVESISSW